MRVSVVLGVFALVVGIGLYWGTSTTQPPLWVRREANKERWWGKGVRPQQGEGDTTVYPFEIAVKENVLTELRDRLSKTLYFEQIEEATWEHGTPSNYTRDFVDYWLNHFDWQKQEKNLNRFNHFKTKIDGINVHFLHIKAKNNPNAKPLLMVHGWPGSFVEFIDIIPMITDPASFGGSHTDAFNLVIPSIPGYGFSEAPHHSGFDAVEAALLFSKLMQRLGYNRFAYQGGDWGSTIGIAMAKVDPVHCAAVHINMLTVPTPISGIIRLFVAGYFPDLVLSKRDQNKVLPVSTKIFSDLFQQTGYMHIQATRPYTVAQALTDSPAGLGIYILEKFDAWSDSSKGDVYKRVSKDKIITNIMIYWITNTISSSVLFYKENLPKLLVELISEKIDFPMAIAEFPADIVVPLRSWVESFFTNIISYTELPRGGHFAAMEEPLLLAEDLWKYGKLVKL